MLCHWDGVYRDRWTLTAQWHDSPRTHIHKSTHTLSIVVRLLELQSIFELASQSIWPFNPSPSAPIHLYAAERERHRICLNNMPEFSKHEVLIFFFLIFKMIFDFVKLEKKSKLSVGALAAVPLPQEGKECQPSRSSSLSCVRSSFPAPSCNLVWEFSAGAAQHSKCHFQENKITIPKLQIGKIRIAHLIRH